MASKWLNLKGRVKWCKPYEPEEYKGDTRWTVTLYPLDSEWDKFNKSGLQLEVKEDDDGKFIRLRRTAKKLFPKDEEITKFSPPTISGAVNVAYVDEKTNAPIRSFKKSDGVVMKTIGEQVNIGNDSLCLVNICTYDTQQGKGHRWEGLTVLELEEYNPTVQAPIVAQEPVPPVKEEVKKAAKKKEDTPTIKEDMSDEIPW